MSLLLIVILVLGTINIVLMSSNKILSHYRKKNSKKFLRKDKLKATLLKKISELNSKLKEFEKKHVIKSEYNDLVHKYNILLNQYRLVKHDNDALKIRIKKLKDKLY